MAQVLVSFSPAGSGVVSRSSGTVSKVDTSSPWTRALPGTAASSPWDVGSGPDLAKAGVKRQSSAGPGGLGCGKWEALTPGSPRGAGGEPAESPGRCGTRSPPLVGRPGGRGGRSPAGPALRRGPLSREYGKHVRITCGRSRRPRRGTGREGGTGRDPRSAGRVGPL